MKARKMIELLEQLNPEANVVLNQLGGDSVLFLNSLKDDDSIIWLEGKGDCDFNSQLKEYFTDYYPEDPNESKKSEFYQTLSDMGIAADEIKTYLNEYDPDTRKMIDDKEIEKFLK